LVIPSLIDAHSNVDRLQSSNLLIVQMGQRTNEPSCSATGLERCEYVAGLCKTFHERESNALQMRKGIARSGVGRCCADNAVSKLPYALDISQLGANDAGTFATCEKFNGNANRCVEVLNMVDECDMNQQVMTREFLLEMSSGLNELPVRQFARERFNESRMQRGKLHADQRQACPASSVLSADTSGHGECEPLGISGLLLFTVYLFPELDA
jgi:hypothetical protein